MRMENCMASHERYYSEIVEIIELVSMSVCNVFRKSRMNHCVAKTCERGKNTFTKFSWEHDDGHNFEVVDRERLMLRSDHLLYQACKPLRWIP